jgi:hypothetical protein
MKVFSFVVSSFFIWLLSALVRTSSFTAPACRPSLSMSGQRDQGQPSRTTATRLFAEQEAAARRPWEFFRFVRQSSKFVRPPFAGKPPKVTVPPGEILWRAGQTESSTNGQCTLAPLDDVVMGGASSSTFDESTGIWSGDVTTANNGGFVGLRSTGLSWDCTACQGLEWKVKHNHPSTRRYKFVMRDTADFNGITWTTSVDVAPGAVTTVRLPFDKQVPALFARRVNDAADFDRSQVAAVQIAYSKFEYNGDLNPTFASGPVKLQLLELATY